MHGPVGSLLLGCRLAFFYFHGIHKSVWRADAHGGICLEFDTTVGEGSNPLRAALHVTYQADFPVMRFFYDTDEERVKAAALTKSNHWKYEKEWRVVVAGYAGQKLLSPTEVLTGVTLGARISSSDEAHVRDWVRSLEHQVELRKASLAKDRYALEINTLKT